jgi:hypothetical protein
MATHPTAKPADPADPADDQPGSASGQVGATESQKVHSGGTAPRPPWAARVLTLIVMAAVVLLFPAWWMLSAPAKPAPCKFSGIPDQAAGSPPALPVNYKPAKLVLISGQTTTLAFNRTVATKTLTIQYGISGAGAIPGTGASEFPDLQVAAPLGFIRDDDQEPLPGDRVAVASWVQNGRVLLKVCVQRSGPGFADPGTYQGTVSIVDPRVGRVDVPVVVTLSYATWQLIMFLLVGAVLAGAWYVWVLQAKKPDQAAIGWDFVDFYSTMLGVLSIGAGIVAAFGVYSATYLNSTTWGSSSGQVFALIGAMFSAFLAGSATVHIGAKAGQATSSPASRATRGNHGNAAHPGPAQEQQVNTK